MEKERNIMQLKGNQHKDTITIIQITYKDYTDIIQKVHKTKKKTRID